VAETVSRIIGGRGCLSFGAVAANDDEPQALIPDVRRLRDEVGWYPQYDLFDGLKVTVKAMAVKK